MGVGGSVALHRNVEGTSVLCEKKQNPTLLLITFTELLAFT